MKKRKCKKCLIDRPISEFRDRLNKKTNQCKECDREYQRLRYKANPEKIRERSNESQKRARRDPKRREKLLERNRKHWREKGKHTAQKYYKKMKEDRPWLWRAKSLARNITKEITEEWLVNKHDIQGGLCALSGRPIDVMTFHIDHIIPKALGGVDDLDNLRLVAPEANMAKSDLTDKELIKLCQDIIKNKYQNL